MLTAAQRLQSPPIVVSLCAQGMRVVANFPVITQAIVFTMLIVRAHAPRENTSTPLPSSFQLSRTRASSRPGVQTSSIGVEINLERVVHSDLGSPRTYVHSDHPYGRGDKEVDDDKEVHAEAY